jgi:multidrug efflux system membrane fusion protein
MLFRPDKTTLVGEDEAVQRSLMGRIARRGVSLALALIVIGGVGYIVWTAFQSRFNGAGQRRDVPVPVLATTPKIMDVPVYFDGVGSVRALNMVTVRAQVDGTLLAVNFNEGQDVKKGDVLAEIDPSVYQAQFDQAVGKKAQDEATLANARIDLTRYQQLASSNAGSKQQADTQRATVAQLEAQLKIDQAAIDNATITLGYTKILAPLSGRTGLRQVDPGNIVHASDLTGLVIITQVKPISVQFSLPQQQLPRVNAAMAKGTLSVDVFGPDGRTVSDTGTLQSVDNQVDQTTGTVRLKGVFPNPDLQLWPGQFVNVRLKVETLPQALVVPTSAVQRGPSGPFAYVIGEGDTISAHALTVVQQNDMEAVIGTGLTEDDRVVTTGFANLAEGTHVVIGTDQGTPTLDLAPRRRVPQQKGQQKGQGGAQKGNGQKGPAAGQKGADNPAPLQMPTAALARGSTSDLQERHSVRRSAPAAPAGRAGGNGTQP